MTPFHAMGMITGLQDVRVFFESFRDPAVEALPDEFDRAGIKKEKPFSPHGTVQGYTDFRLPDVHAMVDLASDHYYELRIAVRSRAARTKKVADAFLGRWMPALDWTTLYARIQFGHERFSIVRKKDARQKRVTNMVLTWGAVVAGGAAFVGLAILRPVALPLLSYNLASNTS